MISITSVQNTIKAIQTKFMTKHKFGQNKTLPNQENTEETTKQHQIKKHLQESKHSHNLTPSPSVHFHRKLHDKTKNHNKNKNKTSNNHLQQHHRTEIITSFDKSYISYSSKPPDDIFESNHQQKNQLQESTTSHQTLST